MREDNSLFNKRAWVALLLAIVLVVAGELILAWQYQRLERSRLPQIEEELARQDRILQERDAKDILVLFLDSRLSGNEAKALSYLTEQSVEELERNQFSLFGDFVSYEIQDAKLMEDGVFRFQTAFLNTQGIVVQLELIEVMEILEDYYINSVVFAG